jgi:hypothetical protein
MSKDHRDPSIDYSRRFTSALLLFTNTLLTPNPIQCIVIIETRQYSFRMFYDFVRIHKTLRMQLQQWKQT